MVLSDYAKGVLTPRVIRAAIDAACAANKPVIVDPKAHDYAIYRGATIITPNRKELSDHTRRPVKTTVEIAAAAADLAATVESAAVLATLSEDGMFLHVKGAEPVHIPAYPVKVRDVSGAGDTVVATLAVLLAGGADFRIRDAGCQCGGIGGRRQERHRRGDARLNCARVSCPRRRWLLKKKIAFDWASPMTGCANGRRRACASVSPMGALIFSIRAM